MATRLPGTTIEISSLQKDCSRDMFRGIFATGGITLSQVSVMTGLEPHVIQNWVKRGFVSSPQNRHYTKSQFARIIIINMLRESMSLDGICSLLQYINGDLQDKNDDLIDDSEMYHRYVDMLSRINLAGIDEQRVKEAAAAAVADYAEPIPGAGKKLSNILQVMAFAHYATMCRSIAERMLTSLE